MPDKTFDIEIRTTADPAGVQEIERELEQLKTEAAESSGPGGDLTAIERESALREKILGTEQKITGEKNLQVTAAEAIGPAAEAEAGALGEAAQAAEGLAGGLAEGAGSAGELLFSILGTLSPLQIMAGTAGALYTAMQATHSVAQSLGELLGDSSLSELASGFNAEALARLHTEADLLKQSLDAIDKQSFQQLEASVGKLGNELVIATDKYREAIVRQDGLLEPILGTNQKIRAELLEQVNAMERELQYRQQSEAVARSLAIIEERKTAELQRQEEILKGRIESQREATRLAQDFKKAEEGGQSESVRLEAQSQRIASIREQLEALGIAAASPHEAYIKSIGLIDSQRTSILRLATEWQTLANSQAKAAEDGTKRAATEVAAQGDLVKKLRELTAESAKPNLSAQERLNLLERELVLLEKIKASEQARIAAANAANPAAAGRVKEISDQLRNMPVTGRPEDAETRGQLQNERNQLIRDTGVGVQDAATAVDGVIKQTNAEIEKLEGTVKSEGGKIPPGLEGVKTALDQALKSFQDGLNKTSAAVDKGIPPVVEAAQTLDGTIATGLTGIGTAITHVAVSSARRFDSLEQQINRLWAKVG